MAEKRKNQRIEIIERGARLKQDPSAIFGLDYTNQIKALSAKNGLGKTYG